MKKDNFTNKKKGAKDIWRIAPWGLGVLGVVGIIVLVVLAVHFITTGITILEIEKVDYVVGQDQAEQSKRIVWIRENLLNPEEMVYVDDFGYMTISASFPVTEPKIIAEAIRLYLEKEISLWKYIAFSDTHQIEELSLSVPHFESEYEIYSSPNTISYVLYHGYFEGIGLYGYVEINATLYDNFGNTLEIQDILEPNVEDRLVRRIVDGIYLEVDEDELLGDRKSLESVFEYDLFWYDNLQPILTDEGLMFIISENALCCTGQFILDVTNSITDDGFKVTIPYDELGDILRPEYIPSE